jgi:hypothetical protein
MGAAMRTQARRVERGAALQALGRVALVLALALLLLSCFAGCVGPGLEPPARDDNNNGSGSPTGGVVADAGSPAPAAQGGNGGSFGNAGTPAAGSGSAAGTGGNAGSPDTSTQDAAMPAFDAGADEDAGID